ncbi:fatty acid desaturase [Salinispirillum marinum]|uniref:Fatty acid desaturase n=2 Tax=Saccharospirillaceae TaxID=255527 RepID=A0ABV8BAA9_9GAMM
MSSSDYRHIAKQVRAYAKAKTGRAWLEVLFTVLPFIALFATAAWLWGRWPWLSVLLTIPTAFFMVRIFLLQHDLGHGSFFNNKTLNKWMGKVLGATTGIPYSYWKRTHAMHHATTGNLDKRGAGDVTTWTVEEYNNAGFWARLGYRFYRHPLVIMGLGPAFLLLKMRIPFFHPTPFKENWRSIISNNVVLLAIVVLLGTFVGFGFVAAVYCLTLYLAMMIGIWLFYVQHQFEDVYWAPQDTWNYHTAAIEGSSQLAMPGFMNWLTANIGLHHIHHLDSRVPFYRLKEVVKSIPDLEGVNKISWLRTPHLLTLTLYDEARQRMVTFRDARRT